MVGFEINQPLFTRGCVFWYSGCILILEILTAFAECRNITWQHSLSSCGSQMGTLTLAPRARWLTNKAWDYYGLPPSWYLLWEILKISFHLQKPLRQRFQHDSVTCVYYCHNPHFSGFRAGGLSKTLIIVYQINSNTMQLALVKVKFRKVEENSEKWKTYVIKKKEKGKDGEPWLITSDR